MNFNRSTCASSAHRPDKSKYRGPWWKLIDCVYGNKCDYSRAVWVRNNSTNNKAILWIVSGTTRVRYHRAICTKLSIYSPLKYIASVNLVKYRSLQHQSLSSPANASSVASPESQLFRTSQFELPYQHFLLSGLNMIEVFPLKYLWHLVQRRSGTSDANLYSFISYLLESTDPKAPFLLLCKAFV